MYNTCIIHVYFMSNTCIVHVLYMYYTCIIHVLYILFHVSSHFANFPSIIYEFIHYYYSYFVVNNKLSIYLIYVYKHTCIYAYMYICTPYMEKFNK